jgi:hypothetical protein
MASEFFGMNRSNLFGNEFTMTTGAATGGTDFELRVDTGKSSNIKDVILFMRNVEKYLLEAGAKLGTVAIPSI